MTSIDKPHIVRTLTKSRLIVALLSELDSAEAIVVGMSLDGERLYHGTIRCKFETPFEKSFIKLDSDLVETSTLEFTCCYGGKRIAFCLSRTEGGDAWAIPAEIVVSDLRESRRVEFAKGMYSAEIITQRQTYYGFAIDMNSDYVAVECDKEFPVLQNQDVKLIVRLVNTNCDVFYRSCRVVQIKPVSSGIRLILSHQTTRAREQAYRSESRLPASGSSLRLRSKPFQEGRLPQSFVIENISRGGLTGYFRTEGFGESIFPGLVIESEDPQLSFLVVWVKGQRFGLRALVTDSVQLTRWMHFLDVTVPGSDRSWSSTRKELAELLTQSGLLKGQRRSHFGRSIDPHLVVNSQVESPLLIQRYMHLSDSGSIDMHVSARRLAENAWFFSEGSSLVPSSSLSYEDMLDVNIDRLRRACHHSPLFCRYVTAIWQKAVKSADNWAKSMAEKGGSSVYSAVQCSIESFLKLGISQSDAELVDFHPEPAARRRAIAMSISPDLFEALCGDSGSHPVMNSELGKLGPHHKAVTKFVTSKDKFGVVVHRVFTHQIWSTTGVTNSVIVIVPAATPSEDLVGQLAIIGKDPISFGTDDFLIVFDGDKENFHQYESSLPHPRRFEFLVFDLMGDRVRE